MKIALVGATGLVGSVMIKVLEEQNINVSEFFPAASQRSVGKKVVFNGKDYSVMSIESAIEAEPDVAIFSAGGSVSKEYAPKFAEKGCFVIDNSSAWRMDHNVPLVVPEINLHSINSNTKIIANPNCSTIQMVVALAPLHKLYKIKRLVIATYQSVTGTGVAAVGQLMKERKGESTAKIYPYQIDLNCFPHGGEFLENGYTSEEMKLVHETRKILQDPGIMVTATVVRIPVIGGHSEAINVEFEKNFEIEDVRNILKNAPGVTLQDDVKNNIYPMPLYSEGKDDVFVGRLRRDESCKNALNMWIVSDNLRKGAATNAVQIAKYLAGLK
ncbi:MAG: aspartate-semialdehyde dehydrogenase [Bacteroidetes bacterium]|nr:aspartate-semialdehyde dehydrogenase [Bacteroidota bacterium]